MRVLRALLYFILIMLMFEVNSMLFAQDRKSVRKVVKYKKHSVVDLTGSMIRGKVRTPEIFYIFQRKRAKGRSFVQVPTNLNHHFNGVMNKVEEVLAP